MVYAVVCVDDIIVTENNIVLIQSLISQLNSIFSLKELGDLDYFLGIGITLLTYVLFDHAIFL